MKLFPLILENLGEESRGLPFIGQLSKLEELGIIPDADEWMLLRETRNMVTHEYPFITDEVIDGLNLLNNHCDLIFTIWDQVKNYVNSKFKI